MSTPNESSRGARDDAPRGERGDYDNRGGHGRRDDRPRGGQRDDRGPRGRDDRRPSGDRDNRSGGDRGGYRGRDDRGSQGSGERRSFGGDRDNRGGYRGDRDNRSAGQGSGERREFRGNRDDSRSGGDRGGYRGNRDDSRSGGGQGDRGGYRGGRDDSRPGGDRGGYRGGRDDSRPGGDRGGYRGGRDDSRPGGDRGGYRGRDDRGSQGSGERRSFGGDRDNRGAGDRGGYRGRDDQRGGGRFERGGRGPGGGRDDRGGQGSGDRRSFGGDRDNRGSGDRREFRGGRDDNRSGGYRGGRDDRGRGDSRPHGDRASRARDERRAQGGREGTPGGPKSESQLSKAARERLNALRADFDPKDEDGVEEGRDTYTDVEGGVRLQKALAAAGVASRRASEEMIAAGRVSVDGQVVRRFGARVNPEASEIRVDNMRVVTAPDKLYFALNKPRGVVSTMWDPEGRPTLADYTGQTEERIFHVGRLDTETEGLILLTNDGELANRLTHPRYKVVKTYIAKVPGPVPHRVVREVQKGIELEDGPVQVDSFRVVENEPPKALVEIRLHEGRKHIVRRLMEAVGHPVADLARTQVGPIDLNTLKLGTMRALTSREVSELYSAAGL
ncbi:pseudouridine synthase [Nocardiopsis sp. NPDC058631]|uniref:pseudouridine synthase n=1 Tax=Nocardiopsis sp. NPDC058631 TaxID=3346566 RepID=UPI00366915BF